MQVRGFREAAQAGSPTPSDLFFEAGGFQLLQELLLIFREDDMVIESVVALLSTLARFDKRNCERIAMIGGVAGVLHVMRIHEEVLVFYQKPPTYNPQMTGTEHHQKRTVKHGGDQAYWG